MAHTPGPWTLKFFNRDVTGACYRPSFVVIGELSIRIGETQKHDADAHLIAAAPDLLEAARYIRDWDLHSANPAGYGWLREEHRNILNAAIAKAEGK